MVGTSYRQEIVCLLENLHSVPTREVNEGERVNNTQGIEDLYERLDEAGSPCKVMTLLERSPLPCFNLYFVTKR